jgi:hypothetical protein
MERDELKVDLDAFRPGLYQRLVEQVSEQLFPYLRKSADHSLLFKTVQGLKFDLDERQKIIDTVLEINGAQSFEARFKCTLLNLVVHIVTCFHTKVLNVAGMVPWETFYSEKMQFLACGPCRSSAKAMEKLPAEVHSWPDYGSGVEASCQQLAKGSRKEYMSISPLRTIAGRRVKCCNALAIKSREAQAGILADSSTNRSELLASWVQFVVS